VLVAKRFRERAEAEISGALRDGIGTDTPHASAEWLRAVVDRLAAAAADEAMRAARAAHDLTAELGYACLRFERAEWARRLEAASAAGPSHGHDVRLEPAAPERATQNDDVGAHRADAPAYASMLVSEIARFCESGLLDVADGTLSERIRSEIERCRRSPDRLSVDRVHAPTALEELLCALGGGNDADANRP
jgi:hypothetical protein